MSAPVPQFCPTPRELDDLELLLSGALAPRRRFDDPAAFDALVTLDLPEHLVGQTVELVDPEGLPLARLEPSGDLTPLSHPEHGPFRRLHLTPAEARAAYAGRNWIPVTAPLTTLELSRLNRRGPLVLLALVGTGTGSLPRVDLLRATLAATESLSDAVVVAVPLAAHGDERADARLQERVVAAYAAGDPVWPLAARDSEPDLGDYPAAVAAVLSRARKGPAERGLVLFFTGLSGSGKSTLARALIDRVLESGERSVTSLDGDVVRRTLSSGLSFSKEDRETNIRRIGWVAAEVARHGGLAVVSPIAPFAQTRDEVRAMVEAAGGTFFLVHVATPVEECERRDRKGLYAKARRGEIPEFTGISSPYEEPEDADVRVDTTGRSVEAALDDVLDALSAAGVLDVRHSSPTLTAPDTVAPASVPAPTHASTSAPLIVPPVSSVQSVPSAPEPAPAHAAHSLPHETLSVLFVCTANVCRSAFMELLTISMVGNALDVASTGTEAVKGKKMDPVIEALLPEGVSGERHRSYPTSAELLAAADLVLTAEQSHVTDLVSLYPGEFRKIFTLGQFAETAASTHLTGRALIEHAGHFRARSTADNDIKDPYRRGPEPTAAAAKKITAMLEVALPSLVGAVRR
ncbi:adenylyl-sulfate kinase [Nocardioides gilvus]|uniref:adenylyl-sulfate kinase n=1 Tax=Nocardioides gilvus TaxID=1735589 RepID=UPI000D74A55F|nr:adenylyl-sulfate kinase [Nocardioides gilvus]